MTHLRKPLLPLFNGQTILRTRRFRPRLKFLTPLLLLAAWCILSPAQAFADGRNPNPGILPPNEPAFGKTYGGWSAAWWQYVLAQPVSTNPLLDQTGANCRQGQSGKVFFLVGTSGGPATRNCTVPADKALFFPLVNTFNVHVPCGEGFPPPPICDTDFTPDKVWVDQLQPSFSPFDDIRDAASNLHASIDGVRVRDLFHETTPYRACAGPAKFGCKHSPAFSITLPADNLFNGPDITIPAGMYSPAVADGFFLLLAPLKPGPHTITFGGTLHVSGADNIQEITYHLVVSPE